MRVTTDFTRATLERTDENFPEIFRARSRSTRMHFSAFGKQFMHLNSAGGELTFSGNFHQREKSLSKRLKRKTGRNFDILRGFPWGHGDTHTPRVLFMFLFYFRGVGQKNLYMYIRRKGQYVLSYVRIRYGASASNGMLISEYFSDRPAVEICVRFSLYCKN